MLRSRKGALRATIALIALWFVVYIAVGHGLGGMPMDHGQAMHGAGICLVLLAGSATLLAAATPLRHSQRVAPVVVALPVVFKPLLSVAVPSRASPVWLQRFLT